MAETADAKYIGPIEVGDFSIDGKNFKHDKSQRKYYYNPKNSIGSDLKEGFSEEFRRRDIRRTPSKDLDVILRSILNDPSKVNDVEFVTRKGTLVKLCQAGFYKKYTTEVWVNLFKGKYYIAVDSTFSEERWLEEKERDYRGYKFEQISTTGQSGGVPDVKAPVNDSGYYYRVLQGSVSSGIESHKILFSAETDCCSPDDNKPVELKTYLKVRRDEPHMFVYQKWWLQVHITGTSKIVCGFLRIINQKWELQSVEEMTAQSLYDKIANDRYRIPERLFEDLANFLKEVKLKVTEEQPGAHFTLKGQSCEHRITEDFLPDSFKRSYELKTST